MKNIVLALVALTGLLPLSASAKPYHRTHVSWIVANRNNLNVDDRYVTLVGHVTRRIGKDEEYWFADSTGQIRLDSENFDLPIGRTIVIGGRIDEAYLGFGHLEVDVRNWHYPQASHPAAPKPASTTHASAPTHAASESTTRTTTTIAAPAPEKPALAPAPEPAPVAAAVPATSSAAAAAATAAPEVATNSITAPAPAPEAATNAAPATH